MGNLYGVIGHPIGHSMSPIMHNDAFSNLGLSHHYHAFDVEKDQLENAIKGIKALGIKGFNVTIPHKVAIMNYLDEIDEEAREIGAVNTVVNNNGKLIGYNTDGRGFLLSLKEKAGNDIKDKSILIIGAGGAARGIYVTLLREGVRRVDVANRTIEKADKLVTQPSKCQSKALSLMSAEKNLHDYEIIINTTSVGMSPNIDEVPLSLDTLKAGTILSDIIYNPLETKWLKEGREKGAIIQNGVGMFVGQGALAFEKWIGRKPHLDRMKQIVLKSLEAK